ncbi:heterokaryon incompatibility protein-domain-containing protein [Paraphoma chrysanthemicola]|nr:heterokaryon incompatibility protein-domain-containing protein [Paraphoma chrysanthemicola]
MSSPEYDPAESRQSRTNKRVGDEMNGAMIANKKSRKPREYKTYDYDPLPRDRGTIRILELFSSEKADAGVLCALITPEEKERANYPYEALSWCWGVDKKNDYIRIQRSNRKTYAKFVSPNLVAALKALRHPDRSRFLWIDMVCIDQDNLDEKNHQVEMMDIIYGNAERVCIWLGEANTSSRMALRFIKHEVSHLQSFDTLIDSENASKKWVALLDLMQRPWFSRRWVVQELALARKPLIYCGNDKISWKKFAIAVELFVEVETATHRLSEVMKKDRQYQYVVPSYFEFVSALGASLLVDATERLFRDYQEVKTIPTIPVPTRQPHSSTDSESSLSASETSDSEDSDIAAPPGETVVHNGSKNRIQPLLSLEYLVSSLTIFETTIPHDTIYALLAIAKDTSPRAVAPGAVLSSKGAQEGLEIYTQRKSYNVDYNLPYVDVCKDFILFAIERSLVGDGSRALDVICRPWAIEERKLKKIREDKKSKKEKTLREEQRARQRKVRRANRTEAASSIARSHAAIDSMTSAQSVSSLVEGKGKGSDEAEEEDMSLPSWVPQLSGAPHAMTQRPGLAGPKMSRINADPLVGLPSLTQRNYSAAETKGVDMKTLKFRKRPRFGYYSMFIRGFRLDVIQEVEQVARNGQIPREWAELGGWEGAKGHPPEPFWRTLVANRGKDGKNPPVYYSRACEESFKKGGLESGAVDTTALIDYERNSVVAQFCRRVQAVTWNRALVKTKAGRLALVGKEVEKGDLVCILYGCSVPVVLRESGKKTDEEFNEEMEEELKDVQRTVVKSFTRYRSRKQRHELRKDLEMARICRQWCKTTEYKHTSGLEAKLNQQGSKEDVMKEILKTCIDALEEFKVWWRAERVKQWPEQLERMRQERKEEEEAGQRTKSSMRPIEQVLQKQTRDVQELQLQRKRRKSRSAADALASMSRNASTLNGMASTAKDVSSVTSKRKPVIDWWSFQYALAAGRRWKKIVLDRREARLAFALSKTEVDWKKQKRDEFEVFKAGRQAEEVWAEPDRSSVDAPWTLKLKSRSLDKPASRRPLDGKVRPSWASRSVEDRLTPDEIQLYDRKIRENLKGRLGEEGYFSYRLLGECYIHGVMDGEAMLYQNQGDGEVIPSMVFEIR